MKKSFLSILAFLYVFASTGATVNLHYCMGKLVDKDLWQDKQSTCGKCGMDKSEKSDSDCCKDEHKQLKISNDHIPAVVSFQEIQLAAIIFPLSCIEAPALLPSSVTEENPNSNAPPLGSGLALHKRNCVFRI